MQSKKQLKNINEEITKEQWEKDYNGYRSKFEKTFDKGTFKNIEPALKKLFGNIKKGKFHDDLLLVSPQGKDIEQSLTGDDWFFINTLIETLKIKLSIKGTKSTNTSAYIKNTYINKNGKKASLSQFLESRFDKRYIARCVLAYLINQPFEKAQEFVTSFSNIFSFKLGYNENGNTKIIFCHTPLPLKYAKDGINNIYDIADIIKKDTANIPQEHIDFVIKCFEKKLIIDSINSPTFYFNKDLLYAFNAVPYVIGFSYNQRWVATQSTHQSWTSCMDYNSIHGKSFNRLVGSGASIGCFIAYVIDTRKIGKEEIRPTGRRLFKPYLKENYDGGVVDFKDVIWLADKKYGKEPIWFYKTISKIIDKAQDRKNKYGKFNLRKGTYERDDLPPVLKEKTNLYIKKKVQEISEKPENILNFSIDEIIDILYKCNKSIARKAVKNIIEYIVKKDGFGTQFLDSIYDIDSAKLSYICHLFEENKKTIFDIIISSKPVQETVVFLLIDIVIKLNCKTIIEEMGSVLIKNKKILLLYNFLNRIRNSYPIDWLINRREIARKILSNGDNIIAATILMANCDDVEYYLQQVPEIGEKFCKGFNLWLKTMSENAIPSIMGGDFSRVVKALIPVVSERSLLILAKSYATESGRYFIHPRDYSIVYLFALADKDINKQNFEENKDFLLSGFKIAPDNVQDKIVSWVIKQAALHKISDTDYIISLYRQLLMWGHENLTLPILKDTKILNYVKKDIILSFELFDESLKLKNIKNSFFLKIINEALEETLRKGSDLWYFWKRLFYTSTVASFIEQNIANSPWLQIAGNDDDDEKYISPNFKFTPETEKFKNWCIKTGKERIFIYKALNCNSYSLVDDPQANAALIHKKIKIFGLKIVEAPSLKESLSKAHFTKDITFTEADIQQLAKDYTNDYNKYEAFEKQYK